MHIRDMIFIVALYMFAFSVVSYLMSEDGELRPVGLYQKMIVRVACNDQGDQADNR